MSLLCVVLTFDRITKCNISKEWCESFHDISWSTEHTITLKRYVVSAKVHIQQHLFVIIPLPKFTKTLLIPDKVSLFLLFELLLAVIMHPHFQALENHYLFEVVLFILVCP